MLTLTTFLNHRLVRNFMHPRSGPSAAVIASLALWPAGCAQHANLNAHEAAATATKLEQIAAATSSNEQNQTAPTDHLKASLLFFGVRSEMTVAVISPDFRAGYLELLAPLVRDRGRLYVAQLSLPAESEYGRTHLERLKTALATHPEVFGAAIPAELAPTTGGILADASLDMAVSWNSLHTWMMLGREQEALASIHRVLKPGGIFALVDYRGSNTTAQDPRATAGYVNQGYAIQLVESAGFKLDATSEINAVAADRKNYERGVWSEGHDASSARDSFTLRFIKP